MRCGVDERFLKKQEGPLPQAGTLVSVGRLAEEKGHLLLLDAASRVAALGVDFRLTLVGDGPMRATLEQRILDLKLGKFVEITGLVGADEVRRRLGAAVALVMASFTEGLPVSVMEALGQGRPVVATNVGATSELVRPETGWLIAPGSAEELAEAMLKALRTPAHVLAEMGRRGAALVLERHNASTEVLKLNGLLQMTHRRPIADE